MFRGQVQRPGASEAAPAVGGTMLPVFVINLDRRPDRWEAISENLQLIGVPAQRLSAVDGACAVGSVRSVFDNLNPAQAACRESHLLAITEILSTHYPAALILEDDAVLAPDTLGMVETVDWWPANTHVVKLDATNPRKLRLLGQSVGLTPSGRMLRPIAWASAIACAYMIDREGAEIVLGNSHRYAGLPADSLLFHMIDSPVARALCPVQVMPGLVCVREGMGSDINSEVTTPRTTNSMMRMLLRLRVLALRMIGRVQKVTVSFEP